MAVVIETTIGDFTVDLFIEDRPNTAKNFLKLCKIKYYNFCLFHSVQTNFIAQTGDPTGSGKSGESIFGKIYGEHARYYEGELRPKIKHDRIGLLSMVSCGNNMFGSQFFVTLGTDLQSLDNEHCVFGEIVEGQEVLLKLNETICDTEYRPYQDIRITHTVILEDPFDDPSGLIVPVCSPEPTAENLANGRIAPDEEIDETKGMTTEQIEELQREREAKAQATILEIIGDLPDSEAAPPENVLFVCKLNPVTSDDDLEIIFSRFGKVKSCEVIRDKVTGDSLQYAFIEFEDKKACEEAYFKMDNVLIDDRRIHVDFSQSVAKLRWKGKGRGVEHLDTNGNARKIDDTASYDHRSEDRGRTVHHQSKNSVESNSRRTEEETWKDRRRYSSTHREKDRRHENSAESDLSFGQSNKVTESGEDKDRRRRSDREKHRDYKDIKRRYDRTKEVSEARVRKRERENLRRSEQEHSRGRKQSHRSRDRTHSRERISSREKENKESRNEVDSKERKSNREGEMKDSRAEGENKEKKNSKEVEYKESTHEPEYKEKANKVKDIRESRNDFASSATGRSFHEEKKINKKDDISVTSSTIKDKKVDQPKQCTFKKTDDYQTKLLDDAICLDTKQERKISKDSFELSSTKKLNTDRKNVEKHSVLSDNELQKCVETKKVETKTAQVNITETEKKLPVRQKNVSENANTDKDIVQKKHGLKERNTSEETVTKHKKNKIGKEPTKRKKISEKDPSLVEEKNKKKYKSKRSSSSSDSSSSDSSSDSDSSTETSSSEEFVRKKRHSKQLALLAKKLKKKAKLKLAKKKARRKRENNTDDSSSGSSLGDRGKKWMKVKKKQKRRNSLSSDDSSDYSPKKQKDKKRKKKSGRRKKKVSSSDELSSDSDSTSESSSDEEIRRKLKKHKKKNSDKKIKKLKKHIVKQKNHGTKRKHNDSSSEDSSDEEDSNECAKKQSNKHNSRTSSKRAKRPDKAESGSSE